MFFWSTKSSCSSIPSKQNLTLILIKTVSNTKILNKKIKVLTCTKKREKEKNEKEKMEKNTE